MPEVTISNFAVTEATDLVAPILSELANILTTSPGYVDTPAGRREIKEMLKTWPAVKAALTPKASMVLSRLGNYRHPSPRVQAYVQSQLNRQSGGWGHALTSIYYQYDSFGYALAQRVADKDGYRGLYLLDPTEVEFKGYERSVNKIEYLDREYDLNTFLHLTQGSILNTDPYGGGGFGASLIASFRAFKLVSNLMLVSARVNATPLLHLAGMLGRAISVKGSDGKTRTITEGEALQQAVAKVQSSGYLLTSQDTSANVLETGAKADFFLSILSYLNNQAISAIGWPTTMVYPSGSGDSNLAKTQLEILQQATDQIATQIANGILEQLVVPLLQIRYGGIPLGSVGAFSRAATWKPETLEKLAALSNEVNLKALVAAGVLQEEQKIIDILDGDG